MVHWRTLRSLSTLRVCAQVNRAHRHAAEDTGVSAATDLIRAEGQESQPLTLRLQSSTFGATTAAASARAAAAATALEGENTGRGLPSTRFTSLPSAFGDDEGFGGEHIITLATNFYGALNREVACARVLHL